jgi:hypothetical protein
MDNFYCVAHPGNSDVENLKASATFPATNEIAGSAIAWAGVYR